MRTYSLSHLTDGALLSGLSTLVTRQRATTAEVLAHLAEVEARKLYLPAAHPSMHSYCVRELGYSEQAALKRIQVARAARRFPVIFSAIAEGSLHLSTVMLLLPYLEVHTAGELLTAVSNKTKSEVERLLAERYPKADVPTTVEAIATPGTVAQGNPESVGSLALECASQVSPGTPGNTPRSRIQPLAPQRFVRAQVQEQVRAMLPEIVREEVARAFAK